LEAIAKIMFGRYKEYARENSSKYILKDHNDFVIYVNNNQFKLAVNE